MRKWLLTLVVTCIGVMVAAIVAATVETIVWMVTAGEWPYPSITQLATDNRIKTITLVVVIVSWILSIILSVIFILESEWESERESKRLSDSDNDLKKT